MLIHLLTMEGILSSSTVAATVLFQFPSSAVCFFSLKMYQADNWALNISAPSLMDFSFFLLRMVCFTPTDSSFEKMLLVHNYSFQIQLPHLESGQSLNCLIDDRLMNVQTV